MFNRLNYPQQPHNKCWHGRFNENYQRVEQELIFKGVSCPTKSSLFKNMMGTRKAWKLQSTDISSHDAQDRGSLAPSGPAIGAFPAERVQARLSVGRSWPRLGLPWAWGCAFRDLPALVKYSAFPLRSTSYAADSSQIPCVFRPPESNPCRRLIRA